MPMAPVDIYELSGLMPCNQIPRPNKQAVRIQPGMVNMPKGIVLAESLVNANGVHTLAANGATAGAFTLTFRGFTTAILAFNASAATVAAALNALPSVGGSNVVGTGTAVNGAGLVLTYSGALFTNMPVELPTLTITTAFATTQPTIVSSTTGSTQGTFGPYILSDGTFGIARALGMYRMSTDSAGLVGFSDQAGGEQFYQKHLTAPVYFTGSFRIEDLPLAAITGLTGGFLDAGAVAQLGKIGNGSLAAAAGIMRLN